MLLTPAVFGAGGGEDLSLTYIGATSTTDNGTSYTFASQSIGTPSPTRHVIVAAATFGGTGVISSPTIGGVAAAFGVNTQFSGGGGYSHNGIFILNVASGTTADISFNVGFSYKAFIAVYTATGLVSATPLQTATDSSSPFSQGITVGSDGGIIIGSGFTDENTTSSWTGLTENSDVNAENADHSTASAIYTTSATPTCVWTPGSATRAPGLTVAYWR